MSATLARSAKGVRKQLERLGIRLYANQPAVKTAVDFKRRSLSSAFYSCFETQNGKPTIFLRWGWTHSVLVHEFGHYLVWAYDLDKKKEYKKNFSIEDMEGDYDVNVTICSLTQKVASLFELQPPSGLPSYYARVNGEELFCECFAELANYNWDAIKAAHGDHCLLKRMEAVKTLIKKYCCRRPLYTEEEE